MEGKKRGSKGRGEKGRSQATHPQIFWPRTAPVLNAGVYRCVDRGGVWSGSGYVPLWTGAGV